MDEFLIIEAGTQELAQEIQSQIHSNRADECQGLGYTIEIAKGIEGIPDGTKGIRGKIEGKNDPRPEAVTWLWDIPKETPEGNYYISSRKPDEIIDFAKGDYTERAKPKEWDEGDDLPELHEGETVGEL